MAVSLGELKQVLPGLSVLEGEDVTARSVTWGAATPCAAKAILRPRNVDEVSRILALCNAGNQAVVPGGGLTGLVQGAIAAPKDYLLSLELMNRIEEIDSQNRVAVVQAGVPLETAQNAFAEQGLDLPLDLGARGTATIGGMISTNAGGNHVIRYGMTRESVLGLEAVLADGTVISSMNRLLKNNAGYDLKQLFIGTEGTLGIVTRAVLRLREKPASYATALVGAGSFSDVAQLLKRIDRGLGGTLTAFEVMWQNFFALVTNPPAQGRSPFAQPQDFNILIEASGADEETDRERLSELLMGCAEEGLIADAVIAKNDTERKALWALRDDVGQMLHLYPLFVFDVSLPLTEMDSYVREVEAAAKAFNPESRMAVFGHVGDGNIHLGIGAGSDDEKTRERIESIVYEPLARRHGSVSAEHGIGLEKKAYLGLSRSPAELDLMRRLKQTLDPNGILNPGKVF